MGEAFDSCRVYPAGIEVKNNKLIFSGVPEPVTSGSSVQDMMPYAGKKVYWTHPVTVDSSGSVIPSEIHLMLSNASIVEN